MPHVPKPQPAAAPLHCGYCGVVYPATQPHHCRLWRRYQRWLEAHRAADPHCTCNDCIDWEQRHAESD